MVDLRTPHGSRIADDSGLIGLALSGSGLKAGLFHIGMLARLAELDVLRQIDVISAAGGGAIVAALYHLHLKRVLDTEGDIATDRLFALIADVERDFLALAQTDLRAQLFANPFANLKRLAKHHSSATRLGTLLDRHLFRPIWSGAPDQPVEMREIAIHPRGDRAFNPVTDNRRRYCKAPWLIINATNLSTGRLWHFDAERMGEPAAKPADRRLSRAPLLARSRYRHLPEAFAGMTLGHAVAASMATPGLLEPLPLTRLYPDPDHASAFLDIPLGDGRIADALGTDVLLERGCGRLIVSDASGFETRRQGSSDGTEALQLAALEANRPGGIVLIHMLREIEALEVKPVGPIRRGRVIKDNIDHDVTSYGVQRSLQKLIAGMRAHLDAPSEIEAWSLMADGYLIAKRAFQQQRQSGLGWSEDRSQSSPDWRFQIMFAALRDPSKKLIWNLKTSRLPAFKGPRLALSEALGFGLLTLTAALSLIALGAFWSAVRPAAGADQLWLLTTVGLLAMVAWLAGRYLGTNRQANPASKPVSSLISVMDKLRVIASTLPLSLRARFQQRASRAFLSAGQLKHVGIEPAQAERPAAAEPKPTRRKTMPKPAEKKAA